MKNKLAAQHTPTPELYAVRIRAVGNMPEKWSIESDGRCYAECASEPDAEMIVRAVNVHEELVSLLNSCYEKLMTLEPHKYDVSFRNRMADAIAKAEGSLPPKRKL